MFHGVALGKKKIKITFFF